MMMTVSPASRSREANSPSILAPLAAKVMVAPSVAAIRTETLVKAVVAVYARVSASKAGERGTSACTGAIYAEGRELDHAVGDAVVNQHVPSVKLLCHLRPLGIRK